MHIETILAAENDLHRERVFFTIPAKDWTLMEEFWRRSETLRSTSFVQEQRGGSFSIKWSRNQPPRLGSDRLDEESIWAMLHKLRPFVLKKERGHLPAVLNVLKRNLSHRALHRHLNQLRDAYMLKSLDARISIRGPDRPPLSHQVVMDWLNSFQYHHDEDKTQVVLRTACRVAPKIWRESF